MPCRLAQQQMTLSNLEWSFHGSSVPSVCEGRANVNALCTSSALKSTSSASRVISASCFYVFIFLIAFNSVFNVITPPR